MPMIDLTLSKGALSEQQINLLMQRATKTLMFWEKIPDTEAARAYAWAFVNEVETSRVFVGGLPPEKPRYRFYVQTIEGLLDERAKWAVMRDLTRLTLEIEGAPLDLANATRVWCLLREYPRLSWGVGGVPFAPSGYASALGEIRFEGDRPLP